jgi:capsular exopolysaccharide synthesis family protein
MMYQNAGSAPEAARLEDYLRAVQRHKWVVVALALLGFTAAFLYTTTSTTTYTASSTILLRPTPVGSATDDRLLEPNLETERSIVASNATAEAVIAQPELGLADMTPPGLLSDLTVEFRPDSEVMDIAYTSESRDEAAAIANAFATNYVNQREGAAVGYYEATITSAANQIEVLKAEAATLQTAINEAVDQTEANERRAERSAVLTSIRNLESAKQSAQNALDTRSPAADVLRTALPPGSGDGIAANLMLTAGIMMGGLIGFVIAFLLERLDTTARDSEDVALALGTNVMGAIPTLGIGHRAGPGSLIMLSSGGSSRISAAREAFRRLRSSIQFLNSSSGVSSLIVTSSSPAEGKSLTSANLAIALAQNGSRCVLVSADLRRPSLEKLFGMEGPRAGLSEYLAAAAELNAEKVPGIDNLWIIRSGMPPSNPGELLSSDRFEQMIKELEREDVEYVVIDTPPVLSTADAVSAARYVDGVVVVVDTERTETSDLLQVRADLERSGSKLLGAVMNRQKFERAGLFKRDRYAYYRADARRAAG